MPVWFSGLEYQWNITVMKEKCPMDLVAQYYFCYFGLDDDGARAILSEAFPKGSCSFHLFVYP
jgi:hypothetical protein